MPESFFCSTALQHHLWIPFLFSGSQASFLDPLSFQLLSGIVFGSLFHFGGSPTSCPDPLLVLAALRHHLRIPSLFNGSQVSYLDPLLFQQLSGIVFRSPFHFGGFLSLCPNPFFVLTTLKHRVQIPFSFRRLFDIMPESPFSFDSSPTLCVDPFIFSTALRHHVRILFFVLAALQHRVTLPFSF